jgi:Flp pilus assembly protein TadD
MTLRSGRALVLVFAAAALLSGTAHAGIFSHGKKTVAKGASADVYVTQVQQAMGEQRYLDAERMLAQAAVAGMRDARLTVLEGEVDMARGRWEDALNAFRRAQADPGDRTGALAGEGVSLSALGRSQDAVPTLERAVAEDPAAWRAWNALAGEYDNRRDWTRAEAAYDHAIVDSKESAVVLNNRGYSRLLQGRTDDAVTDFVAALKKKPDFAEARTNLRLALALKGDYDRALAGGSPGDLAAMLNNAGFAAALRGDYDKAEVLLDEAMKAKGEYYARASDNLKVVHALKGRAQAPQLPAAPQPSPKGKSAADAHS